MALTARQMCRGRDQLALFVVTHDGRLYRASQTVVPRVTSTLPLHDAA
jgi:hypothetical protein